MAHSQLAWNVTGPDTLVGQFHYPLPDHIREGPAVNKHTPKLVHPAMPCKTEERIRARSRKDKKGRNMAAELRPLRNLISSSQRKKRMQTYSWEQLKEIVAACATHTQMVIKGYSSSFPWSCHTTFPIYAYKCNYKTLLTSHHIGQEHCHKCSVITAV